MSILLLGTNIPNDNCCDIIENCDVLMKIIVMLKFTESLRPSLNTNCVCSAPQLLVLWLFILLTNLLGSNKGVKV